MTYYLGYTPKDAPQNSRGTVMFDIEYYQEKSHYDPEKWISEISCLPCVDGLTLFLKDKFSEPGFDYKQFMEDAYEIQEIRGFLWERNDNHPREKDDANNFHYHMFGKAIKEIFDEFCKKYGLWMGID
jgi:hypothetical protein